MAGSIIAGIANIFRWKSIETPLNPPTQAKPLLAEEKPRQFWLTNRVRDFRFIKPDPYAPCIINFDTPTAKFVVYDPEHPEEFEKAVGWGPLSEKHVPYYLALFIAKDASKEEMIKELIEKYKAHPELELKEQEPYQSLCVEEYKRIKSTLFECKGALEREYEFTKSLGKQSMIARRRDHF